VSSLKVLADAMSFAGTTLIYLIIYLASQELFPPLRHFKEKVNDNIGFFLCQLTISSADDIIFYPLQSKGQLGP